MPSARAVGIFISYRRADASWPVRWLADRLAEHFGPDVVFQDVDSIRPGDDFATEIEAAVGACSVLLAVIGPRWLTAEGDAGRRLDNPQDWVRLEIETAIRRGVRIIPVLVDSARMPTAAELPPSLQVLVRRQAVTLSPVSLDTRRLIAALESALAHEGKEERDAGTRPLEPVQPGRSQANRILLSAIQAGLTLTGRAKANALGPAIRAANVVAPERVGWLVGEAEAAVRSIEDASVRSSALAEVAKAVAEVDPERGEALARSIEDGLGRGMALAGVAMAVAVANPERGEALARSIENVSALPIALSGVAKEVAKTDPQRAAWLVTEAETMARSIEDNFSRSVALSGIAPLVAAVDLKRVEVIVPLIEIEGLKLMAAMTASAAMAAANPEVGEAALPSITDEPMRSMVLMSVATAVAATNPERGEALARSIEDASTRSSALAKVAAAVAEADPARGEALARSIDDVSMQASALAEVARLSFQQRHL